MSNLKLINQQTSTFAQMVDKLRDKSEAELKVLYLRLFKNELNKEWKNIVKDSSLKNVTEKDIIKIIQKNRYNN